MVWIWATEMLLAKVEQILSLCEMLRVKCYVKSNFYSVHRINHAWLLMWETSGSLILLDFQLLVTWPDQFGSASRERWTWQRMGEEANSRRSIANLDQPSLFCPCQTCTLYSNLHLSSLIKTDQTAKMVQKLPSKSTGQWILSTILFFSFHQKNPYFSTCLKT